MGNACGGSLRSKYLHSFKHAASKRDSDPDYENAAADSPKKPPSSAPPSSATAAKTDAHTAPAPPAAAMRRGGAGAPVDLGSVLGHPTPNLRDLYALGRKLGQGQFGTTYLCTELATATEYACKSISKRKLITKEDIDDVRREIQIMHHLSGHKNVVAIKGAYEDPLYVHIVMELCAGGELFDRIIQRGHYSERKAAELTRIIVGVVEACHSLGVMHRDLKPENFLLANKDDDLSLKAIDFGLSVFFKPGQVFTDVVGSPYYVAPEVLCKKYGPEADVWTAGVILYILLSGVPPFWAETQQGIFDAVLKGVIDFDSEPWPVISDSAKDLITRMLNPRPAERLSAHEVLCHPWIRDHGVAPDRPLDTAVLSRIKQFSAMNKLKKMALRVIAESLSEEEIAGLKEMFQTMDTDNSGAITYDELKEGLRNYGSTLKDTEIRDLMEAADVANSGTIDYIEFIAATLHLNKRERGEHLVAAFSYFDKDGSGDITVDELQQACQEHNMPDAFLDDVIKEADEDNIQPARDEDEYDFLKDGRKQAEDRLQRALARVKSMAQYPEAREQYSRLQTCVTEQQESKGKMEGGNSLWLPAAETDIPIAAWIYTAMEGPVTASLGPMAPLLRQVHFLSAMAPEHIQQGSEDDVKRLKEHLEVLCRDLLEPEETSSTPMWWRKEVRELLYDTEDRLDEVIIFQAGDFSELIADVEDACERRKRLQLAPNKTTKPDLGEAGLSYFTPQRTSFELSKPISVQGHLAGLCVVGIEDPMNKLVEQLAFDDDKQKGLKVIPIVGFPGVGKTTVAGILYYKYRGKFQCSAFVRVSRTPDTRSLLISILSQIKAPGLCGFPDVHDLIDGIRKHLKGKRYFIIMDDLWTASVWDIISRAFPDADYGSRIITTTQLDDVALACCRYYPDYIEISPLNDDQSKELFFTNVFGSKDHCPPDFKKVSYKIINKCAGLPLAIVSIAGLLASESYLIVEKWENIQDSLPCTRTNPTPEGVKGLSSDTAIGSGGRMLARGPKIEKWKHTQNSLPFTSEGLKQVLNLVCNNLPPHLKACLLYLCMYPEGYLVRKHDLVRQWIAEDFVSAMGGRSAEENAGVYFDELVSRGMVQPAATTYGNEVLSCTVHHMVLDLIRHKSKELNFIITVDNSQSTLALPDEVRRLSVQFGGSKGADVPENILISKVRSLLFWGFFECVPSVVDYALLRVLILHIWADGDETSFDLTSISQLLLLRYLKIECNIMVNLPDEIKGLKCLETLEVDARLSAVPCDIGHLKKLLHLLLPSKAILPKGLDGLTPLLTLGCFDLSKNSTQNVIGLAELTNLQDVHLTYSTEPSGLTVGRMEHLGSILEKFNDLRSLTLHGAGSSSQIISDDGLSIVSPSPALLEKLELLPRVCTLSRLPKWIGELSRLSILKIEVLDLSINDIAILKELASLASLSLSVRTEHAEWIIFDNEGFPVLKYFKFVRTAPYMSFLEGAMPNVQKLKLAFNANRLKPEYSPETFGFQHMTSLTQISVKFGGAGADDSNKRDAECVWKDAFTNHPNNPIFYARWVDCIFNGDKITNVEDTKGHDSRASTSSDTIEVVGQIFKKARLY